MHNLFKILDESKMPLFCWDQPTPKVTNVNEHLTNYVIRMSVSSSIGRNVSSTNHKFNALARCSSTNYGHSFDAFAPNDLFNSSSTFTWDRRLCLKIIQGRLYFFRCDIQCGLDQCVFRCSAVYFSGQNSLIAV